MDSVGGLFEQKALAAINIGSRCEVGSIGPLRSPVTELAPGGTLNRGTASAEILAIVLAASPTQNSHNNCIGSTRSSPQTPEMPPL
jgi:hypothetical protein